ADPGAPLRLRYDVVYERRLPRGLRPEDLDDPAPREPADPEGKVERERPRRDSSDGDLGLVAHPHDGSLAELALDLAQSGVQSLLAIHADQPPSATFSMTSYCAPVGRSREW